MLQIVAGLTAPHAAFETIRLEATGGRGFYVLVAPPSPLRPHAVRVGNSLRYPRRDGPRKRYMSETEVAAMYRDRFRDERQQIDRLAQITGETYNRLVQAGRDSPREEPRARPWLVVSLVPNSPGTMSMSFPGVAQVQQWAHGEHSSNDLMDGFFPELPPEVGVSVQRYTLTSPADRAQPARYPYAACYVDGAGAAATPLRLDRSQRDGQQVLLASHLVFATVGALRILGRHAMRTGAFGDAVVEVRVLTPRVLLGYAYDGLIESYPSGLLVGEARAQLTLPLQSLASDAQEVLIAARFTLTDIFNAFGVAEVSHIAPDGTLRLRYFPAGYHLVAWAQRHGVATSEQSVP
jgi:hypothetical protein